VKTHLGVAQGVAEGAVSVDWLVLNSPLPGTPYSWYVGPGLYAAAGTDFGDFNVYGFGARAVMGARIVLLNAWETYAAITPSYGLSWYNNALNPHWSVDLELGLRFLFPASKSEVVVKELPHPDLGLVPALNAFAPGTSGSLATMKFTLSPPYLDRVTGWTLQIRDAEGNVIDSSKGDGAPSTNLSWNGKTGGKLAPEATYTAALLVTYTDKTTAEAVSKPFAIDMSVPEVTVTRVGKRFSPDGDGTNDLVSLAIATKSKSPLVGWTVTVFNPAGEEFAVQKGDGAPPAT